MVTYTGTKLPELTKALSRLGEPLSLQVVSAIYKTTIAVQVEQTPRPESWIKSPNCC
jgi:hypothetical protein